MKSMFEVAMTKRKGSQCNVNESGELKSDCGNTDGQVRASIANISDLMDHQ